MMHYLLAIYLDMFEKAVGHKVHDVWREQLINIFDDPNKYTDVYFHGDYGTGKSFATMCGVFYDLYRMIKDNVLLSIISYRTNAVVVIVPTFMDVEVFNKFRSLLAVSHPEFQLLRLVNAHPLVLPNQSIVEVNKRTKERTNKGKGDKPYSPQSLNREKNVISAVMHLETPVQVQSYLSMTVENQSIFKYCKYGRVWHDVSYPASDTSTKIKIDVDQEDFSYVFECKRVSKS